MIKKLVYYILTFIGGSIICYWLGTINKNVGDSIGSIFVSAYVLKAAFDVMNSNILRRIFSYYKKVEYKTLNDWITGKNKGYDQLENKILKVEAKSQFLDNLRLIRYQILKLGKVDAKLLRAHLKVVDKNESYIEFLLKAIVSLITGIFLWYVKGTIFEGTTPDLFEKIVNLITYCVLILIGIASLVSNNLSFCYRTRILIELIDTIEDDEYL